MIAAFMHQDDVDAVFRAPFTAVGSDQLGVLSPTTRVHPRAYGTFARLMGPWVRDRHLLDLATATTPLDACRRNEALGLGVNTHGGAVTHPVVAESLGRPCTPI